jgi:ribonuclease HI
MESPKLLNFTDSLNSLYAIRNCIERPWLLHFHKHIKILKEIVRLLLVRDQRNFSTIFAKIKAHDNIWGNERADQLAKQATEVDNLPDLTCSIG